jgi:hypothetical protein
MTAMSGPGDIEGEVSGDEAAWRDLVARFDNPADLAADESPWPARESLPDGQATAVTDPVTADDEADSHPASLLQSSDRARVVRQAGDPRSYSPAEEDDEPYIPAPLPPPAKLDSIAKAAWAGVIGGPGYLLVASLIMHWSISAVDAFVAVAAFVGGFATLVMKLGDHPRDDDDNGAVL